MKCEVCGTKLEKGMAQCSHCGAPVAKKKSRFFLWLLAVALAAVIPGAVFFYASTGSKAAKYNEYISQGDKYLVSMDYENAAIAYQDAIELDPKREKGYENLAQVYIAQSDYTRAREVALEGIKATNGKKLIVIWGVIGDREAEKEKEDIIPISLSFEEGDEKLVVGDPILSEDTLLRAASYVYRDYVREFGAPQVTETGGRLYLTFAGFPGQCVYFDKEDDNYIVDETTGLPFENRKPNFITFPDLQGLFVNFSGEMTGEQFKSLVGQKILPVWNEAEGRYEVTVNCYNCTLSLETGEEGNVSSSAWNELYPQDSGEEEEEEIAQSGRIINAVTGKGVRATLKVRPSGQKRGEAIETVNVSSNGQYELGLSEGNYMLEVSSSGFITEYFELDIKEGVSKKNENYVISPELEEGEIRIVLEWNSKPVDLDAYLSGNLDDGTRIWTGQNNMVSRDRSGDIAASLDVDDRNGYGPETITIYNYNGSFEYHVHDYKHEGVLGQYGATVRVYMPGESSPTVIQAPSGLTNIWNVLRIDHGKLQVVNSDMKDTCVKGSK